MSELIVDALAAYRVTRLVTRDTITKRLREHVLAIIYSGRPVPRQQITVQRAGYPRETIGGEEIEFDSLADRVEWERDDAPRLAVLLLCPWCVGVWVGFGVMVLRRVMPRVWAPIAEGLALGACAALVEKGEPT